MKKGFLIALIFSLVLIALPNQIFAAKSFKDVPPEYWASSDIQDMVNAGILDGYEDGTFRPDQQITREEFAKILVTSFGLDPIQDQSSFSDVSFNRWSLPFIEAAKPYMSSYIGPTGKQMFKPQTMALREDVAVSLVKALNLSPVPSQSGVLDKFHDKNDISIKLRDYVAVAVENGLIQGFEDWTFKGHQPVTRAQAATLLNRVFKTAGTEPSMELFITKFEPNEFDPNVLIFEGRVSPDTTVTADNMPLNVGNDGSFIGSYRFRTSGEKTITFVAKGKLGKTIVMTKQYTINISKPTLSLNSIPSITHLRSLQISGSVLNTGLLKINDKQIQVDENHNFSTSIELGEGLNKIIIEMRDTAEMPTFKYLDVIYAPDTVTSSTYSRN